MRPFSLYVHVPFCLHKCPYCDFNTYALTAIPEKDYVAAVRCELDFRATQAEWKGRPIQSIYFGGGTPSLLSRSAIRKIISEACALFPVAENVEISLEANPGTVDVDKLAGYRDAGVNRISFGAQSQDRDVLKTLGRLHTPEEVDAAVCASRAAGIQNINLDLMYGVPGQTRAQLEQDLRAFTSLGPQHLSCYGLTIEKGTPFFTSYKRGVLKLPPEETVVKMMEELTAFLAEAGFTHYEISNFARPGFEARHNLAYWNGDDYLGLGAGAHSFRAEVSGDRRTGARRWSNFALPEKYQEQATAHGTAESWQDALGPRELMFEFFFLGLRKMAGIRLSEFEKFFGITVDEAYPSVVTVLVDHQLLTLENDLLRLSERGILLADSVIENFASPEGEERRHEGTSDTTALLEAVGR